MMRRKITGIAGVCTFFLVLGFAALAATRASANVTGKWQLSIMVPAHEQTLTVTLKQSNAGKLTGTEELRNGSRKVVGSVTGDKIDFTVSTVTPSGTFNQNYTGTFSGNSMKGALSFMGHHVDWTAKRQE